MASLVFMQSTTTTTFPCVFAFSLHLLLKLMATPPPPSRLRVYTRSLCVRLSCAPMCVLDLLAVARHRLFPSTLSLFPSFSPSSKLGRSVWMPLSMVPNAITRCLHWTSILRHVETSIRISTKETQLQKTARKSFARNIWNRTSFVYNLEVQVLHPD